jgi:pimeloyl-ACP methyl ester carboxylesterase
MKFHKLSTFQFRFNRRCVCILVLFGFVALMSVGESQAQRRSSAIGKNKADKKSSSQPAAKKNTAATNPTRPENLSAAPEQGKKAEDKFAPQIVTMEVKREGIQLVATWFPPRIEEDKKRKKPVQKSPNGKEEKEVEQGKVTSPFILVHDWGRDRRDMLALASFLQSKGHAVIVPDLRGHGASVRVRGSGESLDHDKFKKSEMASAVGDIDQCKRFLQDRNNEELVNIDMLNVIAVGDSSHLALSWAMADWTWGPVAGIKQGKDVKSLVLFSPTKKFAGSSLSKIAKTPLISGRGVSPLPMLVIWGGKSEASKDCSTFVNTLRKFRPEAPKQDDVATRWFKQSLFDYEAPVDVAGYDLARNPQAKKIWNFANDFVSQKVITFKDQFPWQVRGAEAVLKAREAQEN